MLLLLSPAKKQDFTIDYQGKTSQVHCKKHIQQLIETLRGYSIGKLAKLMSISDKLAELNYQRYQSFDPTQFTKNNSLPALLAFQGDVYRGLQAQTFSSSELAFAQDHLRMISGLYGLLRPLDLMQAYRLEMSTPLPVAQAKNLYQFWGDHIATLINNELKKQQNPVIINLASEEYSKAALTPAIKYPVIKVDFKEQKNGKLKTIGLYAKYARGLMARFCVTQAIDTPAQLQQFNLEGYRYAKQYSNDHHLVFIR